MFGITEIVIIAGILLLIFGARKLPAIGSGLGKGITNFRGEMKKMNSGEGSNSDVDQTKGAPEEKA